MATEQDGMLVTTCSICDKHTTVYVFLRGDNPCCRPCWNTRSANLLELGDTGAKLFNALRGLLECPVLNCHDLDPLDTSAIMLARKAIVQAEGGA